MLRDGMQPSLMELDVRYGGIILVIEHLVRWNHKDNCHIKHVDRSDGMVGQETYGYKERSWSSFLEEFVFVYSKALNIGRFIALVLKWSACLVQRKTNSIIN